ncbi:MULTISPECIES: sodium/solute symporter [Pseudonocardia]|uniref:Cation/acetate symporter ActP n=2 Tax=Pseudonocardia TaxID=1847 RepID=A0A1Y2N4W8_PSEAH|nr:MULTISPECIES: cation acetate symporter [Pseudonocardia]OSY42505.1 Cation/acetate symporter ActP [Pseudonocardia autotrophica]TDN76024.1 sodium:solute symporter family protein [Pseudonocardia autotrophica]BBG00001.1 cation acetate symporter [Pseudonocardia autotrophica]GEC25060.1 cation acetate symporter [Pseudonocardia saturnea]
MTVAAVVTLLVVTVLIGARGVAAMRTTSDFLVASRRTSPMLNAAAVSGEYLSAASFLGVAGLVIKEGTGALWYPVGFTAGYLLMLALVAAPMRRTGALTVPGFAEARLGSRSLRRFCAVVVVVIGVLYLVPQIVAAGQLLTLVSGVDYWVGVVVSGLAVGITLALGGMRAATYVQAFQFALKLLLFAGPAIWLLLLAGPQLRADMAAPPEFTHFSQQTPVDFRLDTDLVVTEPTLVAVDGVPTRLAPGPHEALADQVWTFPAGAAVPELGGDRASLPVPGGSDWALPLLGTGDAAPLLATWSVLVATALGTMGLPHIIVRFHTSPDGRGARRTAAITVAMLGSFYLFPIVYGLLGTVLTPELYLSQGTDTAIVTLPGRVTDGSTAAVLTALLTAGAFAAFLATSLGLLLALSGALAHDLMPSGLRRLRLTALAASAAVVPAALLMVRIDVSAAVTSAFTVAASTFCPLLVLGLWWKGLTARGAYAGMVTGLVSSVGAMALSALLGLEGTAGMLLAQPALLSVPLAFIVMITISWTNAVPAWAEDTMLRLHLADRE